MMKEPSFLHYKYACWQHTGILVVRQISKNTLDYSHRFFFFFFSYYQDTLAQGNKKSSRLTEYYGNPLILSCNLTAH